MSDEKDNKSKIYNWLESILILTEAGKTPKEITALGLEKQLKEAQKLKAREKKLN